MKDLQLYLKVSSSILLFVLFILSAACDVPNMQMFVFTKIIALISLFGFVYINRNSFEFRRIKKWIKD